MNMTEKKEDDELPTTCHQVLITDNLVQAHIICGPTFLMHKVRVCVLTGRHLEIVAKAAGPA